MSAALKRFCVLLRDERRARGLRTAVCARSVGISAGYWAQLESGTRVAPSSDVIAKIDSLFGGTDGRLARAAWYDRGFALSSRTIPDLVLLDALLVLAIAAEENTLPAAARAQLLSLAAA